MKRKTRALIIIILILSGITLFFLTSQGPSVDFSNYNEDNILSHIKELSSPNYEGLQTGSKGNQLAMAYIMDELTSYGLETTAQPFTTLIPNIDTDPTFTINNASGEVLQSFQLYDDYNALPGSYGGSIDFKGHLLLAGSNLLRLDTDLIKNSVVIVEAGYIDPKWTNYVLENGGQGLLCCTDYKSFSRSHYYEKEKSLSTAGKIDDSLLVGYLSSDAYIYLLDLLGDTKDGKQGRAIGTIENATIKLDLTFPIMETANIIGEIEGRSKAKETLLISVNLDNTGMGTKDNYFLGTINKTTAIAAFLETARLCANQPSIPYSNIVFIAFNGQEEDLSGATYYLEDPLYPLENTSHIHIGPIGDNSIDPVTILYNPYKGQLLHDQLLNYGENLSTNLTSFPTQAGTIAMFSDMSVPSVIINSGDVNNTYEDTISELSIDKVTASNMFILDYIKHEIYKDNAIDFLNQPEVIVLILIVLAALLNLCISYLKNYYPTRKLGTLTFEELYVQPPFILLRGFFNTVFPYFIGIFMLAVLANINPNTNVEVANNGLKSNFSGYLTIKESTLYLRSMFNPATHSSQTVGNIFEVIRSAGSKTIFLVGSSLILSTILGIIRGLYEGYSMKAGKFRTFLSLILFSIPDVLIVLLGLLLSTFIARNYPGIKNTLPINEFILPLLTLSVLPTIYITRITYITVQDELDKDYIVNAKAVGYSKFAIYTKVMFPAIIFKTLDSIPTIMTMLLSNMIIVEYLFNYNGVVYYLLYLYNRHDVYRFVPLAISLGLIYLGFTWLVHLISSAINPVKQEVD